MRYINLASLKTSLLACMLLALTPGLKAQVLTDGCMEIEFRNTWAYISHPDGESSEEHRWKFWGADNADLDAASWQGGACLEWNVSGWGWYNNPDITMFNNLYGTAATSAGVSVPEFLMLRGEYWEDDNSGNDFVGCGSSCSYNSGCLFDSDDHHRGPTDLHYNIPYRVIPPNDLTTFIDVITANATGTSISGYLQSYSSHNFGSELRVRWTSPRPTTATALPAVICDDGTTPATLIATGAVHGGDYYWYVGGTFVGAGSSILVNPTITTTYRVYTRNGGVNSLCYNEVTVFVESCDENCVTKTNNSLSPTSIDCDEVTYTPVNFNTTDFPSGSLITNVDVSIQWTKTDGSCASPGTGSSFHNETAFELNGPGSSGCASTSLVTTGTYSGGSSIGTVTTEFDESSIFSAGGTPTTGVFDPVGDLSACEGNSPFGNWSLTAGDDNCADPLCVYSYSVEICACRPATPPTSVSASPTTVCEVGGATVTLTAVGGSGEEVRWFSGGCGTGGTLIGSGNPLTIPAPTSTTTYYGAWYVEGTPCGLSSCQSVTVNVDPVSSPGMLSYTYPSPICLGDGTDTIRLSGYSGSITRWELSTNYGGSWTDLGSSGVTDYYPSAAVSTGTYWYRAVVQSGVCPEIPTNYVDITIVPPVGASALNPPTPSSFCDTSDPGLIIGSAFTGGTGSYQVLWESSADSGASWDTIAGANSQNYDPPVIGQTMLYRRIVSSSACADTSNIVVLSVTPGIDNNTITGRATSCGPLDPSPIMGALPSGGTGTLTYQWQLSTNGGISWTNISGATGQNYDPPLRTITTLYRRVVTSGVCQDISNELDITILTPPSLAVIGLTNVSCGGETDASVVMTGSSSNGSIEYSIDGGVNYQSSGSFDSLAAGTYFLYARDDSGCVSPYGSNPLVITQPDTLEINLTVTDASCASTTDGQIIAVTTGGSGSNIYSLNSGPFQPSNTFNSLSSGFYQVLVRDANGCEDTASATINDSYVMTNTVSALSNISCNGANDGSFTMNPSGGASPYQYSLDGVTFVGISTFSGLAPGTYNVTIRDANGCSLIETVVITQPAPLVVAVDSVVSAPCFGVTTSGVFITPQGGTAPYSYAWSNGATSQDITGLGSGSYYVTVTDDNGCTALGSGTITTPPALNMTLAASSNVSCAGAADGTIDMTASGGAPPYNFLWSNGATSEDLSGIAGGTYTVTVTDDNGCTVVNSATITEPGSLSLTTSVSAVTCAGADNGAVDIAVTGGVMPYTYLWSTGDTSQDVSGLGGGTYSVAVTDANGCTIAATATISEPTAVSLSYAKTKPSCYGGSNGAINMTVAGGTPAYNYSWSTGASTEDISSLSAGTYIVTVTDNNGCTTIDTVHLGQPDSIGISASLSHISCWSYFDGAIDITVTGGTGPYSYSWSSGATTADLSGIPAGTYTVTVTDANGCIQTSTYTVTEPPVLAVSSLRGNVKCAGGGDGFVDVTTYGGTPPYTFMWSTGAVSEDLYFLSGGTYGLTITDANGCTRTPSFTIVEPAPLNVSVSGTDPSCNGANDGSVTVTVTGGTTPYFQLWNTFDTASTLIGLDGGLYTCVVTDTNGCSEVDSITLHEPTAIQMTAVVTNNSCFPDANGAIDVTVTGGVAPLSYSWSSGEPTVDIGGLTNGTYTLTVTDATGCSNSMSWTITSPPELLADAAGNNPTCYGANDGFAVVTPSGGVPPYTYTWSTTPPQTTSVATNLGDGSYDVTITDANGCVVVGNAVVSQPAPLDITANDSPTSCFSGNDGTVNVAVSGGVPPYTYTLNGVVQLDSMFTGLEAGPYVIEVEDLNGCSTFETFNIIQPSSFDVELMASDDVLARGEEVFLTAVNTSSITVFRHDWANNTSQTFYTDACPDPTNCPEPSSIPDQTTTYQVTVWNADSCTATDTVLVRVRQDKAVFFPTAFSPNDDGLNDHFDFEILGAITTEVTVFNRWGEEVYYNAAQANGENQGWDGTIDGEPAQQDTYVYQMKVTYFDGEEDVLTGTIGLIR